MMFVRHTALTHTRTHSLYTKQPMNEQRRQYSPWILRSWSWTWTWSGWRKRIETLRPYNNNVHLCTVYDVSRPVAEHFAIFRFNNFSQFFLIFLRQYLLNLNGRYVHCVHKRPSPGKQMCKGQENERKKKTKIRYEKYKIFYIFVWELSMCRVCNKCERDSLLTYTHTHTHRRTHVHLAISGTVTCTITFGKRLQKNETQQKKKKIMIKIMYIDLCSWIMNHEQKACK